MTLTLQRIVPALVAGSILALPMTAQAASRHHHHMARPHTRYFHRMMPMDSQMRAPGYGQYPNIRYFTRNGHVYFRNLDTGEVYLAKW